MAKARKKISGRKTVTNYQKLQKAVSNNCKKGTAASKKAVDSAKKTYIADAVKKGKTATEAKRIANKADTCKLFKKKR
jgi:Mg-chelatase subunit ChlI